MVEGPGSDAIRALFERSEADLARRREEHLRERASQEYQQANNYLTSITNDFVAFLSAARFAVTRHPPLVDNLLAVRWGPLPIESALGVRLLVENGSLDPAVRELRYVLEMSTRYLFADQHVEAKTLDARLKVYSESIQRRRFDGVVQELDVGLLGDQADEFRMELLDMHAKLSGYVHPSIDRIKEHERRFDQDTLFGFETARDIQKIGELAFRTYDDVIVLHLHAIGPSFAGDMFIHGFDDQPSWKFHKAKFTKIASAFFDYKAERKHGISRGTGR